MGLTSVAGGRTLAHNRIKNFMKCDKLVGGFPYLENGTFINSGTWTEVSDHGGGVNVEANAILGMTGPGWVDMEVGPDVLFMCAYKINLSFACNFGFGDNSGPNFHMGGGATSNSAVVGLDGTHGGPETVTEQIATNQYVRWCWKGTYGVKWDYSLTTEGTPVDFKLGGTAPPGLDSWDATGAASFGDDDTMFVYAFPGDSLSLYGMCAVEFPNGFPEDLNDRINWTFDAWEAGNKTHFPLTEEEV